MFADLAILGGQLGFLDQKLGFLQTGLAPRHECRTRSDGEVSSASFAVPSKVAVLKIGFLGYLQKLGILGVAK